MSMATVACDPQNPWQSRIARIERITPETPGVATYDLVLDAPPEAGQFTFRPGQFNMLYLPGVGEVAISISGSPANRASIPHTIREAGNVTRALAGMREGASIGVRGPFGSCWPVVESAGKDVLLVAGGIGLAPLRPVIYDLLDRRDDFGQLTLLYGTRSPDSLLYAAEYREWQDRGLNVRVTVDRSDTNWKGNVGVVTVLLDRLPLPRPDATVVMTCGPEVMMWYAIQSALQRGISHESMYVSLERNMNCAIGLCGHCQLGPEFLCKDGPVFRYDRVASILKVDDL
ncbi:Anaerobic sulfite reductase subunit B [Maioricimonas rarisocia]|uniref:Anaerobic sulfite reductase subunit B n=1 Tax=Maioricimonas rarisocia TaxID=2528026 RepID=A0A517Z6J8_9PLAN|nr:FAD/NAD(P)-binding protein [Maioricimonas rarisocia]QDU38113.1 Anaerobic sulfite reductase subunit B [Maioricimonas rarisocia]